MAIERCCQRLQQVGGSALVAVPQSNCDCEFISALKIDFTGKRNVSILSGAEFPVHVEITHQVLPTVASADVADRTPRKTGIAAHYEVKAAALRAKQFVRADFTTPPGITHAIPRNVLRQQRVEVQLAAQRFVAHLKPGVHEKHRPVRVSQNLFDDLIATVALRDCQAISKTAAVRVINTVVQLTS